MKYIVNNENNLDEYALLKTLYTKENNKQKTFCFTQIHDLLILKERFTPNENLQNEIRQSDSLYHGNQLAEIIIKVESTVSHYFLRRNLLPNQKLVHKLDDGGLLLSCENVNEQEIVPLVQYWMPHLTIVSPAELQEKMNENDYTMLDGAFYNEKGYPDKEKLDKQNKYLDNYGLEVIEIEEGFMLTEKKNFYYNIFHYNFV